MRTLDSTLRLGLSGTGGAPVYAVTGTIAGTVAYNMAGLLAKVAQTNGSRVLLVDAEGYVTQQILPSVAREPVDELIFRDLSEDSEDLDLEDYLIYDTSSGLSALLYPQRTELRAPEIVHRMRSEFDAIVVCCGGSAYASDWLLGADGAVVTGAEVQDLIETLRYTDGLKGDGETLLAPVESLQLPEELDDLQVFRLPSPQTRTFRKAERSGQFATLSDPLVSQAFEPLIRKLLGAPEAEPGDKYSDLTMGESHFAEDQANDRLSTDDVVENVENMRLNARLLNSETDVEPGTQKAESGGARPRFGRLWGGFWSFISFIKRRWVYLLAVLLGVILVLLLADRFLGDGQQGAGTGSGGIRDTGIVVESQVEGDDIELTIDGQTWEGKTETLEDGEEVVALEGPTVAQFKEGFELPGDGGVTTGVFAASEPGEPTVHSTFHRVSGGGQEKTSGSYYAVQDGEVLLEGFYKDSRDGEQITRTYTESALDEKERSFKVRFEAPKGVQIPQLIGWQPDETR